MACPALPVSRWEAIVGINIIVRLISMPINIYMQQRSKMTGVSAVLPALWQG
jgi:hypothetical protein